jgi:hypothetical protein
MSIQQVFTEYLELNKELAVLRKQQKDIKTKITEREKAIKEYMIDNDMDSIALKDGEIILYARKISQTFKKESIVEKLTEKLNDPKRAEELTESILQNKKFVVEDKIRAVIKKK